jgi:uncharacterized protein
MLVQFSVGNFRSFKELVTLSMVAAPIKEHIENNTFKVSEKLSLLKNAVIYGANASGKSNLLYALHFMRLFIVNSSKESQANESINVSKFKLNIENEKKPAVFEIIFIHKGIRYRYGFAVTEDCVVQEWLFYVPNKQEVKVFTRDKQKFNLSYHFKTEESLVKEGRIRKNALFLSVSAQFNGVIAAKIMEWFLNFNCISSLDNDLYKNVTFSLSQKDEGKKAILNFLKMADMGIEDFNVIKTKMERKDLPSKLVSSLPEKGDFVRVDIKTKHKKYNEKGEVIDLVDFDMVKDQSHGTQKFFDLSGSIIDTLFEGKILFLDELDSRLHPFLIKAICELFNSKKLNKQNAQLIFVSHNTNVLDKDLLRRDQIWFVEKNKFGASELFSLVEFKDSEDGKKVRNDASYEKSYLKGIYSAVPCVKDFEGYYGDR